MVVVIDPPGILPPLIIPTASCYQHNTCAEVASAIVTARKMSSLRDPFLGAGWWEVLQQALGELAPRQGAPLDLCPLGPVRPPARHSSKPCSGNSSGSTAEAAREGGAGPGADGGRLWHTAAPPRQPGQDLRPLSGSGSNSSKLWRVLSAAAGGGRGSSRSGLLAASCRA